MREGMCRTLMRNAAISACPVELICQGAKYEKQSTMGAYPGKKCLRCLADERAGAGLCAALSARICNMMKLCLHRESADDFRTRQIALYAKDDSWDIRPRGELLSFPDLQKIRKQGLIYNEGTARLFSHLAVAVQLVVYHRGRRAVALVQQQHRLKLIAGYVSDQHLHSPVTAALAELCEEVLPLRGDRFDGFSHDGQALPDPYRLPRRRFFNIEPDRFLGNLQQRTVSVCGCPQQWPVTLYEGSQTGHLLMVFAIRVTLPDDVTLVHAEGAFDASHNEVVTLYDPSVPVLLQELNEKYQPLDGQLWTVRQGAWQPWLRPAGVVIAHPGTLSSQYVMPQLPHASPTCGVYF